MNLNRSSGPGRVLLALKLSLAALSAIVVTSIVASGCLNRPVCDKDCRPKTTNVFVADVQQNAVDKIDLLFMIDNSVSMADKQQILKLAVPDLVSRLVNPICVSADGTIRQQVGAVSDPCPQGTAREFPPIKDIHIGIVTSSLGTPGDQAHALCPDTTEQKNDWGHLLGSLPRAMAASGGEAFMSWTATSDINVFSPTFANIVPTAGEQGCGYEASLEAWYRFLVDPNPYAAVQVAPCASDNTNPCAAASGTDSALLDQRHQFLRPDSLVAIIMLSDENDCSMQYQNQDYYMGRSDITLWSSSSVCATDPNNQCCYSCGSGSPPSGCSADANCATNRFLTRDQDPFNLRCFDQKRRFGVDFLYPTQRYVNALTNSALCMSHADLGMDKCPADQKETNPLLQDAAGNVRGSSLVFLAGIIGVPWQDIQASTDANGNAYPTTELHYKTAAQLLADNTWDIILGNPQASPPTLPIEPLMYEQVSLRSGKTYATMENLAGPGDGYMANSVNGHEWNASLENDLQYACIFDLPQPRDCATITDPNAGCDCKQEYLDRGDNNPLCQQPGSAPGTGYTTTQIKSKAFPGIRELQVLKDFGNNSIVASICAREVQDNSRQDFGYRPAIAAIVDRLKEALQGKCLPRDVTVEPDGTVPCIVVEAIPKANNGCSNGRTSVKNAEIIKATFQRLQQIGQCGPDTTKSCTQADWTLCELQQAGDECLNNVDPTQSGTGWCYIDPAKGQGSAELVAQCPEGQKRLLRFVSNDTSNPVPAKGSTTLIACLGAELNEVTTATATPTAMPTATTTATGDGAAP